MAWEFPDGEGSHHFTQAFRQAVAPPNWRRALRSEGLPLVALDVDTEDVSLIGERTDQVLTGLEHMLAVPGEHTATPYARLSRRPPESPGKEYLTLQAAASLCGSTPPKGARLSCRNLRLMRDVTEEFRADPGRHPTARELRDRTYSLRAEEADGGVLHWLAGVRDVSFEGVLAPVGTLIALFGQQVLYTFPRWCWAAWWSRRLLKPRRLTGRPNRRNWYEQWRRLGTTEHSLFHFVAELLQRESARLVPHGDEATEGFGAAADEARQDLEELLLRALLADLQAARPGRGPWSRRRRTRRVLFLDLPPVPARPGPQASVEEWNVRLRSYPAMAGRFLRACVSASAQLRAGGVVVVAAGRPADYDLPRRHWARCANLRDGADRFSPTPLPTVVEPLLVPLRGRWIGGGLHVLPVESPRPWPRIRPATEASLMAAAVVGALIVTSVRFLPGGSGGPAEPECFRGQAVTAAQQGAQEPAGSADADGNTPAEQYKAIRASIDALNSQALKAERRDKPVRRVVYLGATVPEDREEAIDNGAIPELRGLWLAQQRLNAAAVDDRDRVRVYVDVRDTGEKFADAPAHAKSVVKQAERHKESKDHRTVVGVVGFSESRSVTRQAAKILNDGQIPVIATTATADAMQADLTYYRPMAPSNSRESTVAAQFARHARTISTGEGQCTTADHALVVHDPNDLFSDELGTMFAKKFGAGAEKLALSEQSAGVTPDDIARTVCARVKKNPATVVYWAARVRHFSAFVERYGPDSGCAGLPLTVLGSNDLTSTALRGKYRPYMEKWLSLYHTVHVLPETHQDNSDEAGTLFRLYVQAFTARDPWLNDGHVALAHDALKTLSLATDRAYNSTSGHNRPGTANTELVKSKLDEELSFQGASGVVQFPERYGAKPPLNKALVILHPTAKGLTVALRCGAFKLNEPARTHWIPESRQACPADSNR
ncbi:hypothetical protein ACFQVC_22860 [Streptomyces monticola]|uniref:Receptor ligand binding region domain-containing protein n=1 Tax=Streptomyces monticola TaxID=2666263 RepID=A0ABW2JNA0_9ACTN